MNSNPRRPRCPAILAVAAVLALAGCGGDGAGTPAGVEPPLAGARIGGPFALTAPDGSTVRDGDFAGQWRIMYFGYTYCPDVCPVDLQTIAGGLRQFDATHPALAAKVTPIFVTIDPQRDTPAVMGRYAAAFHPRLVALTGSPQAIAEVAKSYAVYYARRDAEDASEYLMDHSRQAYLMDPGGKPVALLPSDGTPKAVAAELARWVR